MAFITDTGIANMALSLAGAESDIESLTEKTAEAIQCNLWYDFSRQQILEASDWSFARRRIGLALHDDVISETSTDPWAGVWSFRYQYPHDCIKARKIQHPNAPPDDAHPFDIETSISGEEKTILTDVEDAVLVFTFDSKAPELWSAIFVQGFAHLLSSKITFSLTGKRKVAETQLGLYMQVLPAAAASDANEKMDPPSRDAESVRNGFGSA